MSKQAAREDALIRKIRSLPPEKVAEVEDFVEFLAQRETDSHQVAAKVAEARRPGQSGRCRLRRL
jgi:hypothetical protein